MTTPITKEQAEAVFDLRAGYQLGNTDTDILRKLAEFALAAMDAEPVGFIARHKETGKFGSYLHPKADWFRNDAYEVLSAYAAPSAPVAPKATPSLKAMMQALDAFYTEEEVPEHGMLLAFRILLNDANAAMLQGD